MLLYSRSSTTGNSSDDMTPASRICTAARGDSCSRLARGVGPFSGESLWSTGTDTTVIGHSSGLLFPERIYVIDSIWRSVYTASVASACETGQRCSDDRGDVD